MFASATLAPSTFEPSVMLSSPVTARANTVIVRPNMAIRWFDARNCAANQAGRERRSSCATYIVTPAGTAISIRSTAL